MSHLENKGINIAFFLEISCSGSNVSLHWYHKGSIVYPALAADPVLTPYYPTKEGGRGGGGDAGNIWSMLNAAGNILKIWKKTNHRIFFIVARPQGVLAKATRPKSGLFR